MKLLTGGCFQTLPFPTLDQFHHQTVSEVGDDYPLIQYSYIVKSIHNIWKREQISGSVNMLAIRALWENLENGITSVYRFTQSDKSLIGESSSLTEVQ